MNDTHGVEGKGWYGFDLDGTLAKYDGWKGINHIGEPVKPMVELMKRMHDEGKVVKIVTARVAPRKLEDGTVGEQFIWVTCGSSSDPDAKYTATRYIQDWCEEVAQLGFVPEIVYQKDHLMLELYDDRVKQVVPNEGWLVEDIAMSKRQHTETTIVKRECIDLRWWDRLNCFLLGVLVGIVAYTIAMIAICRDSMPEAEKALYDAAVRYWSAYESNTVKGAVISLLE